MKKILFGAFLILSLCTICISADPVVDKITLDPVNPSPKATITFTAEISGDQITEVILRVNECADICYADYFEEPMTEIEEGKYQKTITLKHSDATYIQYWLKVNDGGIWTDFEENLFTKNLSTKSEDSSPGFELLVFLVSIIILLFIIKIKRR